MSSSHRPIRPLLGLQATILVVLTVIVLAWTWKGIATRRAEVEAPRQALAEVQAARRILATGPYLYLATGDAGQVEATKEAVARMRAGLQSLDQLVDLPDASLREALFGAAEVEQALGLVWKAGPDADLAGAFETLALADQALGASLSRIEARVQGRITRRYELANQGLLLAWGGMLVVMLGTGALASMRARLAEDRQETLVHRLNHELAHALLEAANPVDEAAPAPAIRDIPGVDLDPMLAAARRTVEALTELRSINATIRRSSSFTRDLVDALSMVETEAEVQATAARAARIAYPEADYQLLLVEAESGRMLAAEPELPSACEVERAEQCPAIKKGRSIHFDDSSGLARCPFIKGSGIKRDGIQGESTCVSCAPVLLDGGASAVAQLFGYEPARTSYDELEALSLALGARLGVVRRLARHEVEASTDPLTNLPNRRRLMEELARLDRTEQPYAIIMADIDHFKRINDRHGHEVGDRCLQLFAEVLREACRGTDLPCRMGGEEFVILLRKSGVQGGLRVAMRIRMMLQEAARRTPVAFTVSMGVAARPQHGERGETVIRAADQAMYAAKESGRDQVIPAHSPPVLEIVG